MTLLFMLLQFASSECDWKYVCVCMVIGSVRVYIPMSSWKLWCVAGAWSINPFVGDSRLGRPDQATVVTL